MAIDEMGNDLGFRPDFDSDDSDALRQLDRLQKAGQYRQAQNEQQFINSTINEELQRDLESRGISQQQWTEKMSKYSLDKRKAAYRESTRKFISILEGEEPAEAPEAAPQAGPQAAPQAAPKPELAPYREKVDRGGSLTSDEELEILGAILGPDFKV